MSEVAIRVAVRVRPFSRREMEQNQKTIVRVLDTSSLVFDPDEDEDEFFFHGAKQAHRDITKRVKKKLNMEFDSVFDDEKTNEEIFEVCTKPIVTSVMSGFNCSVFVYGATGAGKTFTMLGHETNPGITFLTMRELFTQMDRMKEEHTFVIGISYLEVYNEQVMNLLTKSGPLKLREDSNGVVVGGLVLKQIQNAEELFDLLILGNKNRTQHPTDANEESSRSHAIFQVHIRMTDKKTSVRRTVKLSMIDLAGSERAQSTKCKGLRFKEGANINKSLLALGNCINKLADGCKHIPYRDSNLTRILKDSLGGNCQTLMIANISPSSLTYEDTYNTLKYASRAKKIRTTLRQNVITTNMPKEFLLKKCNEQVSEIDKLKAENERFKERIKVLEAQVAEQKTATKTVNGTAESSSKSNVDLVSWHNKIDAVYNNFKKTHEKCLMLQSNEKMLNFRIKFKERKEMAKKVLPLDGSRLDNDLSRLGASIDKCTKEVLRIRTEESSRWVKRFKEATRALDNLKMEIQEKELDAVLDDYVQKKDIELENSKLQMKMMHVDKVNNVYQWELESTNKTVMDAIEIIQENYLLLRSMGELDNSMNEKLQSLSKLLQGQRNVKFAEDESMDVAQSTHHDSGEAFHHIVEITDFSDEELTLSAQPSKRKPSNDGDLEKDSKKSKNSAPRDDFQFLRPKALKSINFESESILKVGSNDHELNTTFDLHSGPSGSKVLIDRLNKVSSSAGSSSSSLKSAKSKPPPTSKYTLNINKENKKFSPTNRVKKVARTPSRVAGSKEHRQKLVKSAVASSLVLMPGKDKMKTLKKKL